MHPTLQMCHLANPVPLTAEQALFPAATSCGQGAKKRWFQSIIKEACDTGEFDFDPATVLDRVVVALKSSLHETEVAKAVRAKPCIKT